MDTTGADLSDITKEIKLPEEVSAPIKAGDVAGKAIYRQNGTEIGSVRILYRDSVKEATFLDYFSEVLAFYL